MPEETEWINNFKHNHAYEVQNGWKRWDKNGRSYITGEHGASFAVFVECADCTWDIGSSAVALVVESVLVMSIL